METLATVQARRPAAWNQKPGLWRRRHPDWGGVSMILRSALCAVIPILYILLLFAEYGIKVVNATRNSSYKCSYPFPPPIAMCTKALVERKDVGLEYHLQIFIKLSKQTLYLHGVLSKLIPNWHENGVLRYCHSP